jgi:hypothetical protein
VTSYGAKQQASSSARPGGPPSRGSTPVPNKFGPPQPTPRTSSQPRTQRTAAGAAAAASGLVQTPGTNTRGSPTRGAGPNYNSDSDAAASGGGGILADRRRQQQKQAPHPAFVGTGADAFMFVKSMPDTPEFQTAEARDSLRQTIDSEKSLQGLVKARRDRALELFVMLRSEGDAWQARLDGLTRQLQGEERRRLELATQARGIETESLNLRHKLRQMHKNRKSAAARGIGIGDGSKANGDADAPHTIIRSVLQRYGTVGENEDSSSGDDEYAAVLARENLAGYSSAAVEELSPVSAASGGQQWFTQAGRPKKRKLSKAERLLAAGKIADQLDQSVRVTRLSVESRVAELEATLAEISSLQNQRIGFGATVEEMREKVKEVHRTLQQATWLQSCLPLLSDTVRQREALAQQGEDYGRKILDDLMRLNRADDEKIVVLQERAERNLLSTDQLIRDVQEENAHMSRELGVAVREAEVWRAATQAASERNQAQLREIEAAIDEASRQRRASTF